LFREEASAQVGNHFLQGTGNRDQGTVCTAPLS
jgi:hypothetical protein